MVKIGDKIRLDDGKIVCIDSITTLPTGRYLIGYKDNRNSPHIFLEGDEDFDVIK